MKEKLTKGAGQLIGLAGVTHKLWLDGRLKSSKEWHGGQGYEHEDEMNHWEGIGCIVLPNGKREYFLFSGPKEESYWVRDLEPSIILPLRFWPGDSRYTAPRIVEEEKARIIQWVIDEQVLPVLAINGNSPFPLPEVSFKESDYRKALERGFVYNPSDQRTLVLS